MALLPVFLSRIDVNALFGRSAGLEIEFHLYRAAALAFECHKKLGVFLGAEVLVAVELCFELGHELGRFGAHARQLVSTHQNSCIAESGAEVRVVIGALGC